MTTSRSVRVFLSSTFRDFAEERDLLVRKVFPELRRRARERNVDVIDIDLRWGITPEQAERGEVLPICLAEIDRARPYFFGFIGDRYGWVPEATQYDLSLLVEQPWLDDHRGGKSVTELEMLHGVLNNPAMAGRAFFYFRDTQYSQAKGGAYLSESEGHHAKLELLKTRIRDSGFPVMENYPSPEVLAARVQEDLWRVIDEAFPLENVPDPVTMERRKHEAYGSARLGLYLGGEKYFVALDEAMEADPFKPILITGPSGGGKSALVANWVERYATANPDAWVITHYLGSSADAADPVRMVYRIEREIAQVTGEEDKLEGDPNKILQHFPEWLSRANAFAENAGREWIIVLDGMDKVSTRTEFNWWPSELPSRVKVVASCLDGEMQSALKARMNPCEVVVHPLSAQDGCELIRTYLARFNKVLPKPDVERIVAHPLGGSPLFLRTVAEEMRVFGVHEQLQQRLCGYLESRSMGEVFAKVFERVEEDNRREDIEAALSVLWGALESFAEDELIVLTGLAPAVWSSILNALEGSLISNGGRIAFGHDYLRKAVEDRYVASIAKQSAVMRKLSDFCSERMRSEGRKANSPYVRRQAVRHFIISEQWDEAVVALSDLEFIEARAKAKELSEMQGDCNEAMDRLPEMEEKARRKREWRNTMRQWSADLAAFSAACIRQRADGGVEPIRPKPPKAITLKSAQRIAADCERIIRNPTWPYTLSAIRRFIGMQKVSMENFVTYEGFVAQQAYNDAPAGPIHQQGKESLAASSAPRILRKWFAADAYNPLHPCTWSSDDSALSVAISPDASVAVSGMDGILRVWDLDSGECTRVLQGHKDFVWTVAMSLDASFAVSGSDDKTLRVWDLRSGECMGVFEGHSDIVSSVAISADASFAVSGSGDQTLRVWDLQSGECIRILKGHSGRVSSVAISADASFVVSGSGDHTLRVWDLKSGECTRVLDGHSENVNAVAVSAQCSLAVSVSWDHSMRVWDLNSGDCIRVIDHDAPLCLAISADASIAISGSADHKLYIWDLACGKCIRVLQEHSSDVNSLAISADGSTVVSTELGAMCCVWDLTLGEQVSKGHSGEVYTVAISAHASCAVSGGSDNTLRIWDLNSGDCVRVLEGHTDRVDCVAISADASFALSGAQDKNLRVWDLRSGECARVLEGHSDEVKSVAISLDSAFAVSGSLDRTLRVWDLSTGECIRTLEGHSEEVYGVAISGDSSFAVSGSDDKTLRVWNLASGECIRVLKGHLGIVYDVAISSNGSFAVSGSFDGTVRVWSLASGECIRVIRGHLEKVYTVAISEDDSFVLSCSVDATIRVWEVDSGKCVSVLKKHSAGSFRLHRNRLIIGTRGGEVQFHTIENLAVGPVITTAFRNSTARPVCCGQLVDVPAVVTERIGNWSTHRGEDAYTDPALLMPCPHCQTPLRINPFFVQPLTK